MPPVPWRRVAVVAALLAFGLSGLGLWLVPRIEHSKRSQAAEAQRQARLLVASERRRLRADQRLHRARATGLPPLGTAAAVRRRAAALVARLEASITADARARARTGTLEGPIVRTSCDPYRPGAGAPSSTASGPPASKYACTAVTGDIRFPGGKVAGAIGYPFWARLDIPAGTYVWCKINPRPGEQAIGLEVASVPLPPPCDLAAG